MNEFSSTPSAVRVSVIIPAFKVWDTLEKAVRSVLEQTEQDFEIIIVDDCSPDQTWDVAQQLTRLDSRIRAIRMPQNGGKPIAMNHATEQAKGRWVAILDGDDWYEPTRLKRLIDAAEEAGVEMVADNQSFVDMDSGQITRTAFPAQGEQTLDLDAFLEGSDPTKRFDYGMLKPIFRTDFYRAQKLEYYPPARNGQDYYILLCFFVAGGKGLLIDEPLYNYVPPTGALLRQMAKQGRKRYNYDLMRQVHAHFTKQFRAKLTLAQNRALEHRAKGLESMKRFAEIRDQIHAHEPFGALKTFVTTPLDLWPMVAKRASGSALTMLKLK